MQRKLLVLISLVVCVSSVPARGAGVLRDDYVVGVGRLVDGSGSVLVTMIVDSTVGAAPSTPSATIDPAEVTGCITVEKYVQPRRQACAPFADGEVASMAGSPTAPGGIVIVIDVDDDLGQGRIRLTMALTNRDSVNTTPPTYYVDDYGTWKMVYAVKTQWLTDARRSIEMPEGSIEIQGGGGFFSEHIWANSRVV